MTGIYKILCTENGRAYIGASLKIDIRAKQHFYQLGAGVHYNTQLQNDYNLYGSDCFVVFVVKEVNKCDLALSEAKAIKDEINPYNIFKPSAEIVQPIEPSTNMDKIMEERGVSNTWLGKKVGVTRQTIYNYRHEKTTPDYDVALKICDALKIEWDELIGRNSNQ